MGGEKHLGCQVGGRQPGITPAWAGKSHKHETLIANYKDHPRVGGEKSFHLFKPPAHIGSPPRGRGKDVVPAMISSLLRITPAWAGKRVLQLPAVAGSRDHPRVGGEKIL